MEKIGKYNVIGIIGKGAMGVVYKGFDPVLRRLVAIKTLFPHLVSSAEQRARFLREAEAPARLGHPNIVNIFDLNEENDIPYIVMEFLVGFDLKTFRSSGIRFSIPQVINLLRQTATGLEYAHRHGVIHRDVKPANIILVENDTVKLVDFGVAKVAQSTLHTAHGRSLGTPAYMSPEQVRGEPVQAATDQFSLGVVAYELITGANPFMAESLPALLTRVNHFNPPELREVKTDCPPELSQTIQRMLAKKKDDRLSSLLEFVNVLRRIQHQYPPAETVLEPTVQQMRELRKGKSPGDVTATSLPVPGLDMESGDIVAKKPTTGSGAFGSDDRTIPLPPGRGGRHSATPVADRETGVEAPGSGEHVRSVEKTFLITPQHLVDVARQMAAEESGKSLRTPTREKARRPEVDAAAAPSETMAETPAKPPSTSTESVAEIPLAKSEPTVAEDPFGRPLVKVPPVDTPSRREEAPFLSSYAGRRPVRKRSKVWLFLLPLLIILVFVVYISPLTRALTGVDGWTVEPKITFLVQRIRTLFADESPPTPPPPRDVERQSAGNGEVTEKSRQEQRLEEVLAEIRRALDERNVLLAQVKLEEADTIDLPGAGEKIALLRQEYARVSTEIEQEQSMARGRQLLEESDGLLRTGDLAGAEAKLQEFSPAMAEMFADPVAELRRRLQERRSESTARQEQRQNAQRVQRILDDVDYYISQGNWEMADRNLARAEFLDLADFRDQVARRRQQINDMKSGNVSPPVSVEREKMARQLIQEIERLISEGRLEEAKLKLVAAEKMGVASISQDIERLIAKIRSLQKN
ncbi:MAG: protein kinase [Acidobacteria bacterium]|nr:protein kinase [Acidobacteriota bacterium]